MEPKRQRAAMLRKTVGLVLVAGAALYAFSPVVRNLFGSVKPPQQRTVAGEFTARTLNDESWSLDQQRGKVVLLNIWATWCPPCRIETPSLVALQQKFSNQGFTVAGVTMDDQPRETVPAFVAKYRVEYPILIPAGQYPLIDGVQTLPTSILIDKSGRIARVYTGLVTEMGLSDDIKTLLAENQRGAR